MPTKTTKSKAVAKTTNKLKELATPIQLQKIEDLLVFKCPKCGNVHFRHAGYLHTQLPFMKASKEERLATDSNPVAVCTKCKHCFIWLDTKCYDVTKFIDLKAWEETEKELHQATGPGGQC
jgi:predicted RNA-binding Zn-ribbon protein involved in translation (DUF1610 family)